MRATPKLVAGLLILAASPLRAQGAQGTQQPAYVDSLPGTISALLPSGVTLRGAGATVCLWLDTPELHSALDAACSAARARPESWIAARTELESPSGFPLDSTATADLAILRRLVDIPHATAHADSAGRFLFVQVPYNNYWISAEMVQNGAVVQWWHKFSLSRMGDVLATLFKRQPTPATALLTTQDFTHHEFCTGGELALGAAALEVGQRRLGMSSTPSDSAYADVDEPAEPLDVLQPVYPAELRLKSVEGTVTARFVIDTTGRVDMRTLRITSSPDPRFSESVRDVLLRKRYQPARVDNHVVRWVTSQQFVFSVQH